MPRYPALICAVLAAASLAGGARAAELSLVCEVQANRPDAGVSHWRRRIVLTSADHMARFWDDTGAGFRPKSEHRFVSVSPERIVLENAAGKESSIDRRSGDYVLRNASAHFELHGRCRPAEPAHPRF